MLLDEMVQNISLTDDEVRMLVELEESVAGGSGGKAIICLCFN